MVTLWPTSKSKWPCSDFAGGSFLNFHSLTRKCVRQKCLVEHVNIVMCAINLYFKDSLEIIISIVQSNQ